MTARVFATLGGLPMDGDSYALSEWATEGQLWERLADSWPVEEEPEPDYDLIRKQQIEDELAWGADL